MRRQNLDFHIIIPARLNSSRLPGKLLLEICGKSLLERVYERACLALAKTVVIATDNDHIENAAKKFGATVCRTSSLHPTGTDRLAEAVEHLGFNDQDIIVNLQGDEPLIPVGCLQTVAVQMQEKPQAAMTTLCSSIVDLHHLHDPNVVKVVINKEGYALYFSRALIPFPREGQIREWQNSTQPAAITVQKGQQRHEEEMKALLTTEKHFYRHIGIYAYRVASLKRYHCLPPSPLEQIEFVEPLRFLWHGEQIHVSVVDKSLPPGVDTQAELDEMRMMIAQLESVGAA